MLSVDAVVLHRAIQWLSVLFRTMALVVAAPLIFFTALDIAAYLIARTVGAAHHHRHTSIVQVSAPSSKTGKPSITVTPAVEACSLSSALSSLQSLQPEVRKSPSSHLPTPPSEPSSSDSSKDSSPKFPMHFTSPSEGNFALSGEGMFSPPESRSNSPPLDRKSQYRTRKRAASIGVEALGTITDSTNSETESSSSNGDATPADAKYMSIPGRAGAPLRKRIPQFQFTPLTES